MQWIHGSYLPHSGFYLWGEAAPDSENQHDDAWPFAVDSAELESLVHHAFGLRIKAGKSILGRFPVHDGRAIPSTPVLGEYPGDSRGTALASFRVDSAAIPAMTAIELLSNLQDPRLDSGLFCASDLLYWASLLRFALHLLITQKYYPMLNRQRAFWQPFLAGEDRIHWELLLKSMPPACRAMSAQDEPAATHGVEQLATSFVESAIQSVIADSAPRFGGGKTIPDQWLSALQQPAPQATPAWIASAAELGNAVAQWTSPLMRRTRFEYRLAFRLEEPARKKDYWYVRFFLQKETEPTLLVPLSKLWKSARSAVALFGDSLQLAVENALVSLTQAGKIDSNVDLTLLQSQPSGYRTDTQGAWHFLHTTAWLLQDAGFGIQLPAWWGRRQTMRSLSLRTKARSAGKKAFSGGTEGLTVNFDWKLALGGEEISYDEFMALARLKVPLVKFRGKWMELRPEQIQAAREFWNSQRFNEGNLSDLIALLSGTTRIAGEIPVTDVEAAGGLTQFVHQFQSHAAYKLEKVPKSFHGKLRDYQHRGYSWLRFMSACGLGACLADDMGLGKTIQTIALFLADQENNTSSPSLLICPTSVVGNWMRELERFAPGLKVAIHHGGKRKKGDDFQQQIAAHNVMISSYSLLLRDQDLFNTIRWRGVVLDEAQNIKNAETKQAKAARSLQADYRVALTGTPVENNIGELWSIFEFLNPGLLGTRAEFKERYFNPIHTSNDPDAAEDLKRSTGPFLLRRLKTDPEIAGELPRKMEMKVFCNLTPEQASLYAAVVKTLEKDLEESKGIERKGKVLASLLKLKQICNHPAQFLKDGSRLYGRSGKLARITEMLEEILAVQERILIFTQFVEMGELLKAHLQNDFGREVAFLHGGVPRLAREKLVQRFNEDPDGPPVFLLSLKAGGTGLNLTRANHVFHFDRWWNPAVEDQATDRAYRIGQKRNVQVHKLICVGTLEERIDQMIENKKAIANSIIGAGEAWLTELSTSDIKALVALGAEAVSV